MRVVDSSGWLEFFVDGPLARKYENYLSNPGEIITPTIVLYEVYKKIRRERSEEEALVAAAQMQKTHLVPLTETIALAAADINLEHRLAMADSIVYATALSSRAQLVSSDADFAQLPNVTYLAMH
jgi:predicted nucleic acid-binding protein